MKRVMIVGQPGAGKSTLARMIGEITGLPVIHVDLIHWKPGWVERDKAEKIAMAKAEEAKDEWIFEGGLSQTWANRADRADTIIALVLPLWLRVWRVFWRTIRQYGHSRPDLPDDCPERFDAEFWKWIWDTRRTGRDKALRLLAEAPAEKQTYCLRSPRQVRRFLAQLEWAS